MTEIYESAIKEGGAFGAFFERDDETAYFYLLDMRKTEERIISALRVANAERMAHDLIVSVRWSQREDVVGLLIDGRLIALFDLRSDQPQGRMAVAEDHRWFRLN